MVLTAKYNAFKQPQRQPLGCIETNMMNYRILFWEQGVLVPKKV